MAALTRPTEATYVLHDKVTVETDDNEDHTFCGIMFPVRCKDLLPLVHVVVNKVAVRGSLGPLTVWVSNRNCSRHGNGRFNLHPRDWTKVYQRTHSPSERSFVDLELDTPILLKPGETRAVYIHSTLDGDEAIVYDNRRSHRTHDDDVLTILSGRAHVASAPFSPTPIWGWGNAWRDNRSFVGRLSYGSVFKLWNPQTHTSFGSDFQRMVRVLFMLQRRWESPFCRLPDEVLFYILNMCRWDWAGDSSYNMRELRQRRRARFEQAAAARRYEEEQVAAASAVASAAATAATAAAATGTKESSSNTTTTTSTTSTTTGSATRCCRRACGDQDDDDDDDESFHDALEDQDDDDDDDEDSPCENEEDEEIESLASIDSDDLEEDEEDEEVDSEDSSDDDDDYRSANVDVFEYYDDNSDDDNVGTRRPQRQIPGSRAYWIRRQFAARVHILQTLANLDDGAGGAVVVSNNHHHG